MRKRGRPAENPENPINQVITAKLSQDDIEKLDYCCEKMDITRGAVIRKGIDKVFLEAKKMK